MVHGKVLESELSRTLHPSNQEQRELEGRDQSVKRKDIDSADIATDLFSLFRFLIIDNWIRVSGAERLQCSNII